MIDSGDSVQLRRVDSGVSDLRFLDFEIGVFGDLRHCLVCGYLEIIGF